MTENSKHREILIQKAHEDLEAAKNLVRVKDISEEIVAFHCQQAIEKALKAYLDSKGLVYPKTHDLETLLSMCLAGDGSFNQIEFVTSLTPYAVEIRYDEFISMSKEEILSIVSQAEKALGFILRKI